MWELQFDSKTGLNYRYLCSDILRGTYLVVHLSFEGFPLWSAKEKVDSQLNREMYEENKC